MNHQIEVITREWLEQEEKNHNYVDYYKDLDSVKLKGTFDLEKLSYLIKDEVLKFVIGNLPNQQIHTLPDDVNSPHKTEFDLGWNSYRRKFLLNLFL